MNIQLNSSVNCKKKIKNDSIWQMLENLVCTLVRAYFLRFLKGPTEMYQPKQYLIFSKVEHFQQPKIVQQIPSV
jgi:hypothetical protein